MFTGDSRVIITAVRETYDADGKLNLYFARNVSEARIAELCEVGFPRDYNSPELTRRNIEENPDSPVARAILSGRYTVEEFCGPPPKRKQRQVLEMLKWLEEEAPFRIIFADRCGLLARFLEPLGKKLATEIEQEIIEIAPESDSPIDPLTMREFILKKQSFRLWWD